MSSMDILIYNNYKEDKTMFGSWKINVVKNGMPQKVATAFAKLGETIIGAEYEPIAYLGEQTVNGVNHAVLARQILITGRDTENIVVIIFNERPDSMEATLVSIERVVEGGMALGGVQIFNGVDIPEDAKNVFDAAFKNFVGSKVEPIALLGTQVVNGVNYIFAATLEPVTPNPEKKVAIVVVNSTSGSVAIDDMLKNKHESALGYSFTWLKGGFGKPLGEWP